MNHRIPVFLAAVLLCPGLFAQTAFEDLIRENPERAAGVHHTYEYLPSVPSAAPPNAPSKR